MTFLTLAGLAAGAAETTVMLRDIDSGTTSPSGAYRWLDVADQAYSAAYRDTYDYSQADVQIRYDDRAAVLAGVLTAFNLKPNFAYQVKLLGTADTASNERIGYAGRWWQAEWNDSAWGSGWNLNNKGDGASPNPNDLTYESRWALPDATSPTGRHYRYTAYLVLGYFVTDGGGHAQVSFAADSSYHVLWKTTQRGRGGDDGPVTTRLFDVDPVRHPAYDADYPRREIDVFGEWERLPVGNVTPAAGDYVCSMLLTEESFHGSGGAYAGAWAGAVGAEVTFRIVAPRPQVASFAVHGPVETAPDYTAAPVVDVDLQPVASESPATHWLITGSADPPDPADDGWRRFPATQYTFPGEPGEVTLFAWVKDAEEHVSAAAAAARASFTYDRPLTFTLMLTAAQTDRLSFGQWIAATDGPDPPLDVTAPADTGEPLARAYFVATPTNRAAAPVGLIADYRPRAPLTRWFLRVNIPAGAVAATLSWDVTAAVDAHVYLQQLVEGMPAGRAVDTAVEASVECAASVVFEVVYGVPATQQTPAAAGWDLISPPLLSAQTLPALIDDGQAVGGGIAWVYDGGTYRRVGEDEGLAAKRGFWIYGASARSLRVTGLPVSGLLSVEKGWNLIGAGDISPTLTSDCIDVIWGWDAALQAYKPLGTTAPLHPGRGYWAHATAPTTLTLSSARRSAAARLSRDAVER